MYAVKVLFRTSTHINRTGKELVYTYNCIYIQLLKELVYTRMYVHVVVVLIVHVHEKSSVQCRKKEGANPGQLFRAFARVQHNLSLALLGLSSLWEH